MTAAFSGASATPAQGDTLLLFFSEQVTLSPGALLTNADVVLSGSATLGNVTVPPALLSPNTVEVTLGSGVDFEPDSTTVTLAPGNDAVRDVLGQLGNGGPPITIGTSDGVLPTIANVTVANIDDALNGTGPAGGTLQIPPNGWTLDLAYSDNGAIATGQTQVSANVTVNTPAGPQPPGANLRPFLTELSANNTAASYLVPASVAFPLGPLTLSCVVVDVSGLGSAASTFPATVGAFTDQLRPFETSVNAQQVWFLDFARDVESFTTSTISGGVSVDIVSFVNTRSDFEDLLHVLGLLTEAPVPSTCTSLVLNRFKQNLLDELASLYSGANVAFTLTQPGGSFGSNPNVPYNSFGYSQISIAGSASSPGVLGVAIFDPSNTAQNDNTRTDFGASQIRLGVFLHTIVDSGMGPPASSAFRLTFSPFAESLGGVEIGTAIDGLDGERLLGNLPADPRSAQIDTALADLARFTAVVTAHECGHSVGLVQNGAMPVGLYGNDAANFPGSQDGHIRTAALFPAGAINVMSPALSYSLAINPATGFNTLNLAYLRERIFYGN
ncbi:MAG TPA: hypothetical protein VFT55_10655 [Planctomycetota bacterium]|nr:hypothetical protein [Planctomycetota bacterium]